MLEIGKTEIVRAKELLAVSSSRKELRVEIGTKPFSSSVNGVMRWDGGRSWRAAAWEEKKDSTRTEK